MGSDDLAAGHIGRDRDPDDHRHYRTFDGGPLSDEGRHPSGRHEDAGG